MILHDLAARHSIESVSHQQYTQFETYDVGRNSTKYTVHSLNIHVGAIRFVCGIYTNQTPT